jgi:hypothetical protein
MPGSELTPEQREHVLHAAGSALVDLLVEHPELTELGAETISQLFMAGVTAGADAMGRVLALHLDGWAKEQGL